ncbi:MAG: glycoside hydrolase family 97 C-terminal domain-containing protein, partial [Verrucomicrobia bacterium]|nr:glycoside hydrolase family 97 C-terminal domain-containing protein [Verrucomicrobiota bacterium]
AFAGATPVPARHNAILPFTRFVPGPADCSPVVFDQSLLGATTFAHQLATAGIFTSPLTHWPDHPERYLAVTNAVDVIYQMPTIWDETRILDDSRLGELVAMARRKGDNWYLFLINGDESQSRAFPSFPLSFLHDGTYDAVTLGDQDQTTLARTEHVGLTASSTLSLSLHPGGGFVGMFIRRPDQFPPELDSDGDGVPDLEDCAPDDPALSSLHTFYTDIDRDHYGDREKPVRTCSITPHPPLVSWGNDPNDLTMLTYPEIAPKGNRTIGIDSFQTPASGQWASHYLAELGIEVAPIRLTWGNFETTAGTFDGPDFQQLLTAVNSYASAGLKSALVVSAFENGQTRFPEDLQTQINAGTLGPNDPLVVNRFSAWLDLLATMIDREALHSLQLGEPLDLIHDTYPDPGFWAAHLGTFHALKAHAESLWGEDLPVFQTASSFALLRPPTATILLAQLEAGDAAGICFQPHLDDFSIIEPEYLQNDLEATLALLPDQPVFLIDVAYPSLPAVFSSETKQSQSLRAIFEFWDRHADHIPFMSVKQLFDPATSADPSKRSRFHTSLGLRTHDDQPKTAYKTLRNLAYERGWWRIPPPDTRSLRMGFSQTQFDRSDTLEQRDAVLSWMLPRLAANSDISCLQIDVGIPWVEALADDFTSPTPPYHQQVLLELNSLRESVVQNQPLVVAISPIGNPRSHISAYWGEAEGFYFEKGGFSGPEFVRVPDGVVKADGLRYPPPPWDTLPLNAPEVKSAYLKYCMRIIEFFQPDYLLTALEASATLVEDRERYDQLVDLMKFIYESLKADPRYSDIPQVISISSTSFIKDEYGVPYKFDEQAYGVFEEQVEGLSRLLPYMDILGLSNYPHFGKYNAYTINASMYDSLFENIARAGGAGKPIAISENGYSADPYQILERPFLASPTKQDDYLKNLLYSLEKTDHPVEYIVNWAIRDNDYLWQGAHDLAVADNNETALLFSQFAQYFRDIGLYDGDGGDDRPALARWQAALGQPLVPKELLAERPSYLRWAITHFPEVREFPDLNDGHPWSMLSDGDGDGRLNVFEYLHNSDPHHADTQTPMRITTVNGDHFVELPFNLNASDVEVEIQSSLTLHADWLPLTTAPQIVSGPDPAGNVVLRVPVPPELEPRAFFRLEARLPAP